MFKNNFINSHRKKILDEKCLFIFLSQYCVQKYLVCIGPNREPSIKINDIESIIFDLAFHKKLKESKLQKNALNGKGYKDILFILSRNWISHKMEIIKVCF